jgi:ubiquinone biosynthesis protein UbiJ
VVADAEITLGRGAAEMPDAMIQTSANAFAMLLARQRSLAEALRSNEVVIEGGRPAVSRFLGLFSSPQPAPAPELHAA